MWEKLEKVFEQIGLDYSRQGSYSDGREYPESFFTFWNADTPEQGFYDNKANETVWIWYVYFYTKNPSLLYAKLEELIKLLKENGFIVEGKGRDCPTDNPLYLGRYVVTKYVATNNK